MTLTAANTSAYRSTTLTLGQRVLRGGVGCHERYIVVGVRRDTYAHLELANEHGESAVVPESTVRSLPWTVLDGVASADEIELAKACVMARKASDARKREQAAKVRAAEIEALKLAHPELEVESYREHAARNLRVLLRAAFKGTRLSVKQNTGSMVNSLTVSWKGGPSVEQVAEIAGRFQSERFNGMTDSYDRTDDAWTDTFGGCSGISYRRAD